MECRSWHAVPATFLFVGLVASTPASGEQIRPPVETQPIFPAVKTCSEVANLVALGWNDFFLSRETEIGLSQRQAQELLSIQVAFSAGQEMVEQRLEEAELDLFRELDRDPIVSREVEDRVRWVLVLRGEPVALRFRYLLRALNILTSAQRQKLTAVLGAEGEKRTPPGWDPQRLGD